MLKLRRVKHLADRLGVTTRELDDVVEHASEFCEELELYDPQKPNKNRRVLNVTGRLRLLQNRFYTRILLPKLIPSVHSHGGVREHHIKTNVSPHIKSVFGFTTDIHNYFPSISHTRVYKLFNKDFLCTPDVSRICTKLCTYNFHLALGLVTSPILADQIIKPVDARISTLCKEEGLVYTRFVDDITITAKFNLNPSTSGVVLLVTKILKENGFLVETSKHQFGRLSDGLPITTIRIKNGRLDVTARYMEKLDDQIEAAASLARDGPFNSLYFTMPQIRGRVDYACWINHGRRLSLLRRFRSINWKNVELIARSRGLVVARKCLRKPTTGDALES